MKRILAVTLAMILLLSMVACSGSKPTEVSKATGAPAVSSNVGSSEKKRKSRKFPRRTYLSIL